VGLYELGVFALAYVVAVATPGPGIAAIIARTLSKGTKGAPAFIAGFLLGDLVWLTVAALGLAAIGQRALVVLAVIKYAGAAYLLYLAYRLWNAPPARFEEGKPDAAQSALQLFAASLSLTLGNPKTALFFLALLPSLVKLEELKVPGFLEIAAICTVVLPAVLAAYTYAAARARRLFRSERALRRMNRGAGAAMAGAAVAVATR
jgi:threonine/homoserine/homoserine lactone efflux protein